MTPIAGPDDPRPDFTEVERSSVLRHDGRLLKVREDVVRLPDGRDALREYVVHPGAAVIVPLFDDGDVLLEWQFRYPLRRHFVELPAGKLEHDEPPIETARRELLEETGYIAGRLEPLCEMHPCIGYADEVIHYFVAQDLKASSRQLDDEEFLSILKVPFDTALGWIADGRISEAKTIVGLLRVDLDRRRRAAR
ncbi:MAG: NUDIX hydrolase [Burkholderiales bacterium]|nr:NUDIX hydrolase [Burkholderiales bacterium]